MGKRGAQAQNIEDSIQRYVEPRLLVEQIVKLKIPHYNKFLQLRDRALISLIAMSGLRITEILSLTTDRIRVDVDPDFLVIDVPTVLKKYTWIRDKKGNKIATRKRIVPNQLGIKKNGAYKPLIECLLNYLEQIKPGKLFDISRGYAWRIINDLTGLWPHYFRSQLMSHYVNTLKGAGDATAKIMKVRAQTVSHYYKSSWKDHADELP